MTFYSHYPGLTFYSHYPGLTFYSHYPGLTCSPDTCPSASLRCPGGCSRPLCAEDLFHSRPANCDRFLSCEIRGCSIEVKEVNSKINQAAHPSKVSKNCWNHTFWSYYQNLYNICKKNSIWKGRAPLTEPTWPCPAWPAPPSDCLEPLLRGEPRSSACTCQPRLLNILPTKSLIRKTYPGTVFKNWRTLVSEAFSDSNLWPWFQLTNDLAKEDHMSPRTSQDLRFTNTNILKEIDQRLTCPSSTTISSSSRAPFRIQLRIWEVVNTFDLIRFSLDLFFFWLIIESKKYTLGGFVCE